MITWRATDCYDLLLISHARGEWRDCVALARVLRKYLTETGNARLRDWEKRIAVLHEIEASAYRNLESAPIHQGVSA